MEMSNNRVDVTTALRLPIRRGNLARGLHVRSSRLRCAATSDRRRPPGAPADKLNRQLRDASLLAREHSLNPACDAVFGNAGEERLERDPRLQPSQRCTYAEVDTLSESQVRVWGAA